MKVEDGQQITRGTMLCEWDPHNVPLLSEVGGKVRYEDIVEDETMRIEVDPSGHARRTIVEHGGDLLPQMFIEDGEGHILAYYDIPEGAGIEVAEGQMITAGTLLAGTPHEVGGTQDVGGDGARCGCRGTGGRGGRPQIGQARTTAPPPTRPWIGADRRPRPATSPGRRTGRSTAPARPPPSAGDRPSRPG